MTGLPVTVKLVTVAESGVIVRLVEPLTPFEVNVSVAPDWALTRVSDGALDPDATPLAKVTDDGSVGVQL